MVFICMPGVTWCDYPWPPIISTSATFITIISIITIITTRTWTWLDKRWKGWWKQCRWASWHLWYLLSLQQHFGIWPFLYLLFFSFSFQQLKKVLINGPLMRLLSSYNICTASFSPFCSLKQMLTFATPMDFTNEYLPEKMSIFLIKFICFMFDKKS